MYTFFAFLLILAKWIGRRPGCKYDVYLKTFKAVDKHNKIDNLLPSTVKVNCRLPLEYHFRFLFCWRFWNQSCAIIFKWRKRNEWRFIKFYFDTWLCICHLIFKACFYIALFYAFCPLPLFLPFFIFMSVTIGGILTDDTVLKTPEVLNSVFHCFFLGFLNIPLNVQQEQCNASGKYTL